MIVTIRDRKRRKVSEAVNAADPAPAAPPPANEDRKPAIVRAKKPRPSRGLDDRHSTETTGTQPVVPTKIVTARRPGKAKSIPDGWLPETPEEHQRVGDLADAMFQEMKRRIAEKLKP